MLVVAIVTGLVQAAEPVWPKGKSTDMNACYNFTCELPSSPVAREVTLRYAAASFARVTLDGEFVSFGPARAPKGWYRLEEIPLYLSPGQAHRLNIEVVAYNINTYCESERPGVLQAEVVANGQVIAETRAENGDFTARRGARIQKVSRYSYQRGFNEAYRLPQPTPAVETLEKVAPLKIFPRCAPVPDFSPVERVTHLKDYAVKYDLTKKIRANWGPDGEGSQKGYRKTEQEICVFEAIQRYVPTEEKTSMKGALYCFDRLETGFPSVRVKCTAPGHVILRFAEVLSDGVLNPGRDCTGNGIIWDLTEAGEYELTAFEPYAFKYIDVLTDASIVAEAPQMRRFINPTMNQAQYRGNDPVIRSIFEAARHTIAQNSPDIFMDCPGRERAGWLCDSFFSARSAQFFSGRTDVERAYLENFARAEGFVGIPEGMVPMCYPSDHPNLSFIPNWAMWFIIEVDDFVSRTGDREFANGLMPRVDGIMKFLAQYENADGLLEKLPSWVFVEWSESNKHVQDVSYPSNMLWAEMLDAAARLKGDPTLARKAAKVRETVCQQSFDGTWFHDNAIRGADGVLRRGEATTETCQYYAFWTKTATPKTHAALWQTMTTDFGPQRKETKAHPTVAFSNAFIGNYLRLMCLSREGLKEQVLKEIRGYFAGMAQATGTLWEYDATQASCCHGFASYVAVLIDEALR